MSPRAQPPLTRGRVLTIRARLCFSYAALVAGCGAVLITLVYLYMRYVPTYDLQVRRATEVDSPGRKPTTGAGPGTIQPAQPLEIRSVDDVLENLLIASVIALGVLIVLGGVLGWVVAGRIIEPLAAINTAANRAAAGTLHHRLEMPGPRDEIRELAETFDGMLASLERSFDAQQRFAANASHELRSPLTTVKTMIDVTLAEPGADSGELRALAERIRDVNQSNIDTVEALLDLANAGNTPFAPERIDLRALIDEVAVELAAEIRRERLTLATRSTDAWVLGNPTLVRQAVSNLLRNAVRHNHPAGQIAVGVTTDGSAARLTVSNTGTVLSERTVARLAEPFVRLEGRGVTRGGGHGLGLAIVSAIARAHDGSLELAPNPDGGLTAVLGLPMVSGR